MLDENFDWLTKWYHCQCDGDWEHQFGIKIETLDNPGWTLLISIEDTALQDKKFQDFSIERTKNDWVFCKVRNGLFEGNCGVLNFKEMLQIFRDWVENE